MQKIKNKTKRAFTLIELLVVILIISLIYGLTLSYYTSNDKSNQKITPLTLKEILQDTYNQQKIIFLCTNDCTSCYVNKDGNFTKYENDMELKGTVAYTINQYDELKKIDYGNYKDEPICLIFSIYPNGSSTQMILSNNQKSYFLPAYGRAPIVIKSPEDAKALWLENSYAVSKYGDFY